MKSKTKAAPKKVKEEHSKHLPPKRIDDWAQYAGGTSAAEGKHSYSWEGAHPLQVNIIPVSAKDNVERHLGYSVLIFGANSGWGRINRQGEIVGLHMPQNLLKLKDAVEVARKAIEALIESKGAT